MFYRSSAIERTSICDHMMHRSKKTQWSRRVSKTSWDTLFSLKISPDWLWLSKHVWVGKWLTMTFCRLKNFSTDPIDEFQVCNMFSSSRAVERTSTRDHMMHRSKKTQWSRRVSKTSWNTLFSLKIPPDWLWLSKHVCIGKCLTMTFCRLKNFSTDPFHAF